MRSFVITSMSLTPMTSQLLSVTPRTPKLKRGSRRTQALLIGLIVLLSSVWLSVESKACGPYFYEDSDAELSELSSQYRAAPLFFNLLSSLPHEHEARPVIMRLASRRLRWIEEERLYQACQPHVKADFGAREREVRAWCAEHQRLHHSKDRTAHTPPPTSTLQPDDVVYGPSFEPQGHKVTQRMRSLRGLSLKITAMSIT